MASVQLIEDRFPPPFVSNHSSPLDDVSLRKFQRELNSIAGLSRERMPNLRVVWGASMRPSEQVFRCGVLTPPLYYDTISDQKMVQRGLLLNFETTETVVGVPRFAIQQLHLPEEYKPTWEAKRYFWDQETGLKIDVNGEPPPSGLYSHLLTIAHHDERCCDGLESKRGRACFGVFRLPSERDLQEVRRMLYEREQAIKTHQPGEAMQQWELEQVQREQQAAMEQRSIAVRQGFKDAAHSSLAPMAHRLFTDDESVERWGRFHFIREGGGHTKSGLSQEEIKQRRLEKSVIVGAEAEKKLP